MEMRVLVLTEDPGLSELLRTQVENLGCSCTLFESYDAAAASIEWADAAVIDLVGSGLDSLHRLRVEAPRLRVLAIAPDDVLRQEARDAGAELVLLEPFTISEIVDGVRALGPSSVIDLRTGERTAVIAVDDTPWWATR